MMTRDDDEWMNVFHLLMILFSFLVLILPIGGHVSKSFTINTGKREYTFELPSEHTRDIFCRFLKAAAAQSSKQGTASAF